MQTHEFVRVLLDRVEKEKSPYVSVGPMDQETCELVSAVNNLGLAIWQPITRQVYVRMIDCERYLASKGI